MSSSSRRHDVWQWFPSCPWSERTWSRATRALAGSVSLLLFSPEQFHSDLVQHPPAQLLWSPSSHGCDETVCFWWLVTRVALSFSYCNPHKWSMLSFCPKMMLTLSVAKATFFPLEIKNCFVGGPLGPCKYPVFLPTTAYQFEHVSCLGYYYHNRLVAIF